MLWLAQASAILAIRLTQVGAVATTVSVTTPILNLHFLHFLQQALMNEFEVPALCVLALPLPYCTFLAFLRVLGLISDLVTSFLTPPALITRPIPLTHPR